MTSSNYDVIILGAGPAGEGAAINAAKLGNSVAVIDNKTTVGGNCTHLGTIPSKALRHAVKQIFTFNKNPMFREIGEPRWFSFQNILKFANEIVLKQVVSRTQYYSRNRVALYFGEASFVDNNTIQVKENSGTFKTLTAKNIIIATGSRPYRPSDIDFTHPRVYDSDTILNLEHTPRRMIIYGAGVIGCEYASIFSNLGVLVDLIDTRKRLLSFLDKEISDALSYHLRNNNVIIRHSEHYTKLEATEDGVSLLLESGKTIKANALLWANGRTGNTEMLKLSKVGIDTNRRKQITVNDFYQTQTDNIYAVGDVIGWPSLASASYNQGRLVAFNMKKKDNPLRVTSVPTGIYTIPEISSLGKTEEELTQEAIPYEVGKAWFSRIARAQITGETVGMLKILFHQETLEILGLHCFGDQAAEIVHIGQAIMQQAGDANSLKYFLYTTFNYPTMAEAYRIAALDGLNRLNQN